MISGIVKVIEGLRSGALAPACLQESDLVPLEAGAAAEATT